MCVYNSRLEGEGVVTDLFHDCGKLVSLRTMVQFAAVGTEVYVA